MNKVTRIDNWTTGQSGFTHDSDLFPKKYISALTGCEVIVGFTENPPLVQFFRRKEDSKLPFTRIGYYFEILNTIELLSGINFVIEEMDQKMNDIFQITGPESAINADDFEQCRTYPIFVYKASWYVPEFVIHRCQGIIRIFERKLWFAVLLAFILGLLTFYLLNLAQRSWNFTDTFFDVVKSYLSLQTDFNFKRKTAVFLFVLWLFYCLKINTAYQSSLIGFLSHPADYPPI